MLVCIFFVLFNVCFALLTFIGDSGSSHSALVDSAQQSSVDSLRATFGDSTRLDTNFSDLSVSGHATDSHCSAGTPGDSGIDERSASIEKGQDEDGVRLTGLLPQTLLDSTDITGENVLCRVPPTSVSTESGVVLESAGHAQEQESQREPEESRRGVTECLTHTHTHTHTLTHTCTTTYIPLAYPQMQKWLFFPNLVTFTLKSFHVLLLY